jgi:hypothetical protein
MECCKIAISTMRSDMAFFMRMDLFQGEMIETGVLGRDRDEDLRLGEVELQAKYDGLASPKLPPPRERGCERGCASDGSGSKVSQPASANKAASTSAAASL